MSHGLEIVAAQIINMLGTLEVQVEPTQSYHKYKKGVGIMILLLEEMGIMTMCLSLSTMSGYLWIFMKSVKVILWHEKEEVKLILSPL